MTSIESQIAGVTKNTLDNLGDITKLKAIDTNSFNLIVCFYHVTYEFESESTLYSCLNVKELLARSRRHI